MSANMQDDLALIVKANFGVQLIRLMSGQISLSQFLKYAIFRPVKLMLLGFAALTLVIFIPIEVYCWYAEHTSFTYHLIKGDLESISGKNSRKQKMTAEKAPVVAALLPPSAITIPAALESAVTEQRLTDEKNKTSSPTTAGAETCPQAADGLNGAQVGCKQETLVVADDELNRVYKELIERLNRDDVSRLRREERHWVQLRDSRCDIPDSTARLECLISETRTRTEFLRGWH